MESSDLENRLIDFSVAVMAVIDSIENDPRSKHLYNQLMRSATSASLNYGEAQAAESRRDFIHKMRVALKELRESFVCLKILKKSGLLLPSDELLNENDELISIFVSSVVTATKNLKQVK